MLVLSQLPPPVHGSTVMTQHFVDTARVLGYAPVVVQRRFSRTAGSVGTPSASKIVAVPSLVLRLVATLHRLHPRVCVFFLTNRPGSFLVDGLLLAVLRAARVRTILYVHTGGYRALRDRGRVWRALLRTAFRSREVVALGNTLVEDLVSSGAGHVEVVPNMTDPPARVEERPSEGLRVVQLSNLDPEKGADAFIRLAEKLSDFPDLRFTLAGAGTPTRAAEVVEAARRTTGRAEYIGAVDAEERWQLLEDADVLVFPSRYRYEAQPLTIIEAMSVGLPVIAYDVGGVRDVVADGESGRLVVSGDEEGLAAALLEAADPAVRARWSEEARARYVRFHSPEAYRVAWKALLE